MLKACLISLPTVYVTGVIYFGAAYLASGHDSFLNAIAVAARWPTYIHVFLG